MVWKIWRDCFFYGTFLNFLMPDISSTYFVYILLLLVHTSFWILIIYWNSCLSQQAISFRECGPCHLSISCLTVTIKFLLFLAHGGFKICYSKENMIKKFVMRICLLKKEGSKFSPQLWRLCQTKGRDNRNLYPHELVIMLQW
jgi:hypothetical protein